MKEKKNGYEKFRTDTPIRIPTKLVNAIIKAHKEIPKPMVKVEIIESESGWGRKVVETKEFKTLKQAQKFVDKYNKPNVDDWNETHTVPEWYMQAVIVE